MSARAELVSMVNDIRIGYDRGQGTLGEVADRVQEICRRVELEAEKVKAEGCDPDCKERDQCEKPGEIGHLACGHCPDCDVPRHHCGHYSGVVI